MNTLELACLIASFEAAAGKAKMSRATISRATRHLGASLVIRDGSTWLNNIVTAVAMPAEDSP